MTDEHCIYSIYASITDICAAYNWRKRHDPSLLTVVWKLRLLILHRGRERIAVPSVMIRHLFFFFSFLLFLSLPSSEHCLCYHSFSFLSLTLLPFYSIHFLLSTVCEIILFSSRLFSSRPLLSFPQLSLHLRSLRLIPSILLLSSPLPSFPSSPHPCSCQQH